MKKTKKTAMTAAAFAAAMNLASSPAPLTAEAAEGYPTVYRAGDLLYAMFEKDVGDINGDGGIGLTDVIFLYKYLINQETMTYEQYVSADVNQDERVNIFDFILLKQALLSVEPVPVPVYGPPEWFETTDATETEYNPETDEPVNVYGPPAWFDITEPETETVTDPLPEPVYGPPEYFGITENPEE